ncbi:type II toxin-antitoxin system prevent-host-death family antitoxin [Streptomyces eurythermus]
MAAEDKLQHAEDGVVEVGMADARAALTALVREVRYGGKTGALTERGTRQVVLVTPEFYERAVAALGTNAKG